MKTQMVAALVAITTMGCLDVLAPDVGPELEACLGEDSDPGRTISFATDIRNEIMVRPDVGCVRCHTPEGTNPIGLQIAGFDVSTYASLRRGGMRSGTDVVIAGDPCASILDQKLGEAPPFGGRMPYGGPYVDAVDQQRIRDWIAEGANDN